MSSPIRGGESQGAEKKRDYDYVAHSIMRS